jgi:hypothetical protein
LSRWRLYAVACVLLLHLFLVLTVSCQQTLWILAGGYTSLPQSFDKYWYKAQRLSTALLGQTLTMSNPVREGITAYIHSTGIEGGYGFFAPGVPSSYKLVFELHYPDGRVEYELPRVSGVAAGLRFTSLLDQIGRTQYDPLREVMLKMLAYSARREHPDATMIRTVFGYVDVPSAVDVEQGKKESYNFLYAYDFVFPSQPANPQPR